MTQFHSSSVINALARRLENREVNQAPCLYAEIISLSTFKDKLKNFLLLNTLVWACVSGAQADEFTNQDFLALPEAHQKFWIQGAIDSIALLGGAKNPPIGQCILEWYYGDQHAKSNGLILASMRKYVDARPSSIMLALAEKTCGKIRN